MEEQTEEQKRIRRAAALHIRAALLRIILIAACIVFVSVFVLGARVIESNDMFPQVRAGDLVFFFRPGELRRNDVVIYRSGKEVNIGRIAAAENDIVGVTDRYEITINGNIQPVQKRAGLFYRTFSKKGDEGYPLMVKQDEYFILGDCRSSAEDSRAKGPVRRQEIEGKVFMSVRRRSI